MSPRAVLVGLPGTGKSTTGKRLAKILAVAFSDSDELIELAAGRSPAALLGAHGEATFRAVEADAIARALEEFGGVLSLGGGAVGAPRTRAALLAARVEVVQLRAPLATLAARVGDARTRPLLRGDPAGRLASLAAERQVLYDAVATMTVQTESRTAGQVAAAIAARLHEKAGRR
jgi:shikimate kinase